MTTTVGVVGLGRVGLPLALTLAQRGFAVLGWDRDSRVRECIELRAAHINEPSVQGLLEVLPIPLALPERIAAEASVIFLVVGTTLSTAGHYQAKPVIDALSALRSDRHPAVAVLSTVSPGVCRQVLHPVAQRSGTRMVYAPTAANYGSVVLDLANPELVIIGHDDTDGGVASQVGTVLHTIAPHSPQKFLSYESAELARLAITTFGAFKISFANLLGRMAEDYYGADIDAILDVLAFQRHIGGTHLRAGTGYGGGWDEQVRAFTAAGGVITGPGHMNHTHLRWVVDKVIRTRARTFTILGRVQGSGDFADLLEDALERRRMRPVPVREAEVVILTQPLHGVPLCERIRQGTTVIDLWRNHPYLAQCGMTYLPFGSSQ